MKNERKAVRLALIVGFVTGSCTADLEPRNTEDIKSGKPTESQVYPTPTRQEETPLTGKQPGLSPSLTPTSTFTQEIFPTSTQLPTETQEPAPEIKVSDITPEDRLYDKDVDWLQGKPIPFGFTKENKPWLDWEDMEVVMLSGILLEKPALKEENGLLFLKLGMLSSSEFRILNVGIPAWEIEKENDFNLIPGLYWPVHYIYSYYRADGETIQFVLQEQSESELVALDRALDLYADSIGRQIAFSIPIANNSEQMREYWQKELEDIVDEGKASWDDLVIKGHQEVIKDLPHFYEVYRKVILGDSSYDQETILIGAAGSFHVPVCVVNDCD